MHLLFSLWLECSAITISLISLFSVFSQMDMGGWTSILICPAWSIYRIRKSNTKLNIVRCIKNNKLGALLFVFCIASWLIQPHCFLDSYSYRIPQLLFWLQEGHPWSVPHVDMRINQMPHVWPFLCLPFYQIFGERGLAVPNMISFILLYKTLKDFAIHACNDPKRANWITLIFMSAPVMVMQAPSNDNVLSCITFLSIALHLCFFSPKNTKTAIYSALAFAICCGIKPQYLTLAPLWLAWLCIGKNAPIRTLKWIPVLLSLPLLILCSPLPTLGWNQFKNGSFNSPKVESQYEQTSVQDNSEARENDSDSKLVTSHIKLTKQMLALPVNPLYGKINQTIEKITSTVPQLSLLKHASVQPLLIAEVASLSFLATLSLIFGLARSRKAPTALVITAITSFIGMNIAIFITTPGTLGRSFVGFFVLMLPLAFCGLSKLKHKTLCAITSLCLLMGLGTIGINPAAPLWPVKAVAKKIPHAGLKREILRYAHYSQRHHGGEALLQTHYPRDKIGLIIDAGVPIGTLWNTNKSMPLTLIPLPEAVSNEDLQEQTIHHILVRKTKLTKNGMLTPKFLTRIQGTVIASEDYTAYMQRGPEHWSLIQINP